MGRPLPLDAEIIRRGDDPATEMMLPQPIDDHPGEQAAAPCSASVSQAAKRDGGSWSGNPRGADLPRRCVGVPTHQHGGKAGAHDAFLLRRIAAFENVGVGVEMRKPRPSAWF